VEKCPDRQDSNIHGDVIKQEKTALIIVDMINKLDFPEARQLLKQAIPAAKRIAALKAKFNLKKRPIIYVNDNFRHWHSDWKALYQECLHENCLGRPLAQIVKPEDNDYFILKPKHSGFYLTPLELLLNECKIKRVVIVGVAGNICVLFTAHEAHMRGYSVVVPKDCVASNTKKENQFALRQLSESLGIPTPLARSISI
jgi:nicotinamidase-related amidase